MKKDKKDNARPVDPAENAEQQAAVIVGISHYEHGNGCPYQIYLFYVHNYSGNCT